MSIDKHAETEYYWIVLYISPLGGAIEYFTSWIRLAVHKRPNGYVLWAIFPLDGHNAVSEVRP
ncbi:hypothetical protein BECAL_02317 [Bellilinea caldifistulae]|nr:hypothetical protein BECAL_02317 [Bellilinea caldifistulae]